MLIERIRIKSLTIDPSKEGNETVTGSYCLVNSKGKDVATQAFNGFSDVKVPITGNLKKAVEAMNEAIETEISELIGLND